MDDSKIIQIIKNIINGFKNSERSVEEVAAMPHTWRLLPHTLPDHLYNKTFQILRLRDPH